MTYTLEPDLPNREYQIKDCLGHDEPKMRLRNTHEPKASIGAAIGIIGGADGPTLMIVSQGGETQHSVFSALHFKSVDEIEWEVIFHEKLTEDVEVDLLDGG